MFDGQSEAYDNEEQSEFTPATSFRAPRSTIIEALLMSEVSKDKKRVESEKF